MSSNFILEWKTMLFYLFLIFLIQTAPSFGICSVTDYDILNGSGTNDRNHLQRSLLFDDRLSDAFESPVDMICFTIPLNASHPTNNFCGTLNLIGEETQGHFNRVYSSLRDYIEREEGFCHLPPFSQSFVQHGSHLIPVVRGRQNVDHGFWDLIVGPGRVWDEESDHTNTTWSRASLPLTLVSNNGDPKTYNGVITFLFHDAGEISNVAYEIVQETSAYFRGDFWGIVNASYEENILPPNTNTTTLQAEYETEVNGRIQMKNISEINTDYGIDLSQFGREKFISFYALYIDGVAYAGGFNTREGKYGRYPYPESMIVSSRSIAKTLFTGLLALALEEEYGSVISAKISDLVSDADESWDGVTIGDALDMSTGRYLFERQFIDERAHSCDFYKTNTHPEKLDISLTCYERRTEPGEHLIYHSTDTYVAITAMRSFLEKLGEDDDLIEYYNSRILRPLGVSKVTQESIATTTDEFKQPIGSLGLLLTADDIMKIVRFLNPSIENVGKINEHQALSTQYLNIALQQNSENRGKILHFSSYDYWFKLGFWARELVFSECPNPILFPLSIGISGSMVSMLPNNTTYVQFTSSYDNDFKSYFEDIAHESMKIRCP